MRQVKRAAKKEPVLLVLVALVAFGQFAVGWAVTGRPDANLLEALATAIGAVIARFLVYSPHTVDEIRERYHRQLEIRQQTVNSGQSSYRGRHR